MTTEVMSFVCSDSCENSITKEKVHTKGSGKLQVFRVSWVLKQWTGIFKVSTTWTNLCNNMVEEKAGVEKQNSKKGFEKNEHACSVEGVFVVSDLSARPCLRLACPTRKVQI